MKQLKKQLLALGLAAALTAVLPLAGVSAWGRLLTQLPIMPRWGMSGTLCALRKKVQGVPIVVILRLSQGSNTKSISTIITMRQ